MARSMADSIRSAVLSRLEPVDHVLFMGQLAGGSIDSLIFVHFTVSSTLGMCAEVMR